MLSWVKDGSLVDAVETALGGPMLEPTEEL
jgi:hypothetical protein